MKALEQVKRAAMNQAVDHLLANPEKNIATIMDALDKLAPKDLFPSQRTAFREAIDTKNNWYQLMMRFLSLNPEVVNSFTKTFLVDGNLMAWPKQEEMREKYKCNIPWAILLDPTSACNLHCKGCWAADYGHALNLSYDDIDSIINQGVELGVHIYIYTGGEPLVRKKDLIRLCEAHPDCSFLCFTNSTLIDEDFCQELLRVKNFVPAISAEGSEETTDARRGDGVFESIDAAMRLLREHGLPFGISACFTSQNADAVISEEYYDWMIEQGAIFCWFFTFMPVGSDALPELMPTVEQRTHAYEFIREMRHKKALFTLDFQNDGEFVGGCIAGGRRYLHINARGDVEPCVFIHYSNANIHEQSLLDCLRSPIFMEYYKGQPFNDNYLKPCPMLENPDVLPEMVERSGAKCTNLTAQESAGELCAKCHDFAAKWDVEAQKIWTNPDDPQFQVRHNLSQGLGEADKQRLKDLGRTLNKFPDEDGSAA